MLKIEGLNWSWNIVITSYSFLHVLTIVYIFLFNVLQLLLVGSRWQIKCKDSLSFLEIYIYWSL